MGKKITGTIFLIFSIIISTLFIQMYKGVVVSDLIFGEEGIKIILPWNIEVDNIFVNSTDIILDSIKPLFVSFNYIFSIFVFPTLLLTILNIFLTKKGKGLKIFSILFLSFLTFIVFTQLVIYMYLNNKEFVIETKEFIIGIKKNFKLFLGIPAFLGLIITIIVNSLIKVDKKDNIIANTINNGTSAIQSNVPQMQATTSSQSIEDPHNKLRDMLTNLQKEVDIEDENIKQIAEMYDEKTKEITETQIINDTTEVIEEKTIERNNLPPEKTQIINENREKTQVISNTQSLNIQEENYQNDGVQNPYVKTILPRNSRNISKDYNEPVGNVFKKERSYIDGTRENVKFKKEYHNRIVAGDSDRIWEAMQKMERPGINTKLELRNVKVVPTKNEKSDYNIKPTRTKNKTKTITITKETPVNSDIISTASDSSKNKDIFSRSIENANENTREIDISAEFDQINKTLEDPILKNTFTNKNTSINSDEDTLTIDWGDD